MPEIQDAISRAHFGKIAHQLKVWALEKRKPWFLLLWEATCGFFPPRLLGVPQYMRPATWLQVSFTKRHWEALAGYPSRIKLFSSPPRFQENVSTIDALRRQLAHTTLPFEPPFEKRYPYLDRDLLEFTLAIPREQQVRPKQRRSLMRRALAGIVPDEILNRKGKAFVARSPLVRIASDWVKLVGMTQHLLTASLGIVDPRRFADVLQRARRGEEIQTVRLMRTISVEDWVRDLSSSGIVSLDGHLRVRLACPPSNHE
jgi:asparagine synthase (glutamine-hydrolysing)